MNETWLAHHGILGQKWGIRRFQNKDGSLTSKGKQRYGTGDMTHDRVLKEENKKLRDKLSGINPKIKHPVIEGVRKDGAESAKKRNKEWNKNRSNMSDKELNDAIDRLKKEKQLHDAIHPGEKYAKDIMSDVGKKVLVTAISGAALYGGKYFISKLLRKNGNADLSDSDLDAKINHLRKINELNKLENPDFDAGDFADAIFNGGAKKKK